MNEQEQAKFEGWAVVEMMGHRKEVGYVTTEHFGAASLFRVDSPELSERDHVLSAPEWILDEKGEHKKCPAGTKVRRAAVPAKSCLVGPGSIYAITPCTEASALRIIEQMIRRPLIILEVPGEKQLLQIPTHTNEAEALAAVGPDEVVAAGAEASDRVCRECGATPEEDHDEGCSFAEDEEDKS